MKKGDEELFRIAFDLEQDEDGYPPAHVETLWARKLEQPNAYQIDNIAFFAKCVSVGDVVEALPIAGTEREAKYQRTISCSGHWTLRVLVFDESLVDAERQRVCRFGCSTELSHLPRLFAVDVPLRADRENLMRYLANQEDAGALTYEEAAVV